MQQAKVEVVSRRPQACARTTWVSDARLLCEVPRLPLTRQALDAAARTVAVTVVVDAARARSLASGAATLLYTGVSALYACDNDAVARSQTAMRTCFTCCRAACVRDEFAQGGAQGRTFSGCDRACQVYCGYRGARRLLAAEGGAAEGGGGAEED